MAINKIVLVDGTVKLDISGDTVTADKVLAPVTFHGNDGIQYTGECTYDSDTTDATIQVAEMLKDKTAYARGAKLAGTMPNRGKQTSTITAVGESITIQQGYHDGSGTVSINSVERAKIIPGNIAEGCEILGVRGTHKGASECVAQAKSATPSFVQQTILPDSGYTHLTQVTIAAIPLTEVPNGSGTTLVIG